MAENKFDLLAEGSGGSSLIPTEDLRQNLFQDAYQPDSINSSQPILNDATNINGMIRWFNEQYSKLGGTMGNLDLDFSNDEPKLKRMGMTDGK